MQRLLILCLLIYAHQTTLFGQVDTIISVFDEQNSDDFEWDETRIYEIPTDTVEHLPYTRMYASLDAAFGMTENSLFFPESYHSNGVHIAVGFEINNTQAFRFFDMGYTIPIRTPSFTYRDFGIDYPGELSVKKANFYMDYGYLRTLGSHRHMAGAKFAFNVLGSNFFEDNVTDSRLFYGQLAIELGPSYMFQTSSKKGFAFRARADLPLLAHYNDGGFYDALIDFGTLNKYIAPDVKLELLLNGREHRPVISLYYRGNYHHNKYAKDMPWVRDYSHSIGTKVYFGNYEGLLNTLHVILLVLGGG